MSMHKKESLTIAKEIPFSIIRTQHCKPELSKQL